jgi:adenylate cyclase
MGEDDEATVSTLTGHRNMMVSLIEQHRGRVVDSPGDNLLAEFSSVVDAVKFALEIHREISERNDGILDSQKVKYRFGINIGEVVEDEGKIYGDGVNIAARKIKLQEKPP